MSSAMKRSLVPRRASRSAVLAAGFIGGLVVQQAIPGGFEVATMVVTALSMAGWLTLRSFAGRQAERLRHVERERQAARLAHRIDRHIPRGWPIRARRTVALVHEPQYMPVVLRSLSARERLSMRR